MDCVVTKNLENVNQNEGKIISILVFLNPLRNHTFL